MDVEGIIAQYSSVVKIYWLPLALGFFGLIFFIYGLIGLLNSASKSNQVELTQENPATQSATLISIDVEGAVSNPGVYKLGQDSIIQDALIAAEGLSKDVDRQWMSKNLNLAAKLYDGAKVYIPTVGESITQT